MGKIVFWIVVIIGGLFVARLLARQAAKEDQPRVPPLAPSKNKAAANPEAMVRCAHCGIHMPRSEALLVNGQTWCSKDHAKLGVHK